MQESMMPSSSTFPAPARASDPAREMIHQQPTFAEIEKRLGTPFELPGDFEKVRELAHALGNLAQKSRLANYLSDNKSPAPVTPPKEIKGGRPPDFDMDDTIQWVGRTI
ncbi:MAG TPA: hypothetical protein VNU49_09745 [Opitutaceae bacterium]|jgi:hypothetical protein|nr:hypothetical protein [Opitutaceae bacterium]